MERQTVVRGCGCAVTSLAVLFLGLSVLTCAGMWGGGAAMNRGPVSVAEINPSWTVLVRGGDDADGRAAIAVARAIEGQCIPMDNGVRVLFNHAWYNAITDGYDAQIWVQDKANYDEYALYVFGRHAFLRDEVGAGGYVNRVLTCEHGAERWLEIIAASQVIDDRD
jgi:hypothetical protein